MTPLILILVDDFESFCGKSITLTKEDTPGVILLDYKVVQTEEKSKNCAFSLSTGDENLIISIALKVNHVTSLKRTDPRPPDFHVDLWGSSWGSTGKLSDFETGVKLPS